MKNEGLLIIGAGSFFAGDDAAGLEVIRRLKKNNLPPFITLKEAETPGIDFLEEIRNFEEVWIVDAVDAEKEAGEIIFADISELQLLSQKIVSLHGLSLYEALELANLFLPEEVPRKIKILGIQKASIEGGNTTISEEVAGAISNAVKIILAEINKKDQGESA